MKWTSTSSLVPCRKTLFDAKCKSFSIWSKCFSFELLHGSLHVIFVCFDHIFCVEKLVTENSVQYSSVPHSVEKKRTEEFPPKLAGVQGNKKDTNVLQYEFHLDRRTVLADRLILVMMLRSNFSYQTSLVILMTSGEAYRQECHFKWW